MAQRKVNFAEGEYYHLYNRGNSKQKIFHDREDALTFKKYLYIFNQSARIQLRNLSKNPFNNERDDNIVSIGAYVIMPNHFHILVKEKTEGGISKFMQKLSTGYAMYYNQKYQRTGGLFEGKFKSEHLHNDRYLKYIFSYIHLNPLKLIQNDWKETKIKDKIGALRFLDAYWDSSYLDYLEIERCEKAILNKKDFPSYFPTKKTFQDEIWDWITYNH